MTGLATYFGRSLNSGEPHAYEVVGSKISAIRASTFEDSTFIAPSFVDLQVNGFQGLDLNEDDLSPHTVENLCDALRRVGVAAYLPTIVTASVEDICQRLAAIKAAFDAYPLSKKMVAGIHVEGPAISALDGPRGAHPAEHIRPPSLTEFDAWQEASGGQVKMITLAPESPGAEAFIKQVTSQGILVALGHSEASEEDIHRAVDAGATLSTHLGNGIAANLPRHPNAIWAQLAEDRLTASFIADGHHLTRSTLISMLRAKGLDRSILVSDSVVFAGMTAGRYSSHIGGEVEVSKDGRVSVADTAFLAGSGACLLDVVCGLPKFAAISLADAMTMTSHNPARILGGAAELVVGAPANFILFDHDIGKSKVSVRDIIFDGESVLT